MKTKPSSIKTIVTISGIMGVLLGIAITYLLFPRVVTEQNMVLSEKIIRDTVFIEKEKLVYRQTKKMVPKDDMGINDSLAQLQSLDSTAIIDSLNNAMVEQDTESMASKLDTNSVVFDTTTSSYETVIGNGNNKIRVAENELVHVAYIKLSGNPAFFYCRDEDDNLDSLLIDNYVPKPNTDEMRVEFWSSPINAIGYRLSKNRLVLFGFYEYKSIHLKYLEDGGIQMNYFDNVYSLKCGDEFSPLNINKRQ